MVIESRSLPCPIWPKLLFSFVSLGLLFAESVFMIT